MAQKVREEVAAKAQKEKEEQAAKAQKEKDLLVDQLVAE